MQQPPAPIPRHRGDRRRRRNGLLVQPVRRTVVGFHSKALELHDPEERVRHAVVQQPERPVPQMGERQTIGLKTLDTSLVASASADPAVVLGPMPDNRLLIVIFGVEHALKYTESEPLVYGTRMATEGFSVEQVHTRIAALVLGVPTDKVSPQDYDIAIKTLKNVLDSSFVLDLIVDRSDATVFARTYLKSAHRYWHYGTRINPTIDAADMLTLGRFCECVITDGFYEGLIISSAGPKMQHGIYDHFKGGVYKTQSVIPWAGAEGGHILEYVSLNYGTDHSRLCQEWNEIVAWPDGRYRSRFVYRGPDLNTPPPTFKVEKERLP